MLVEDRTASSDLETPTLGDLIDATPVAANQMLMLTQTDIADMG